MALTVAQVAALPDLGLLVRTASAPLDREVRWVAVSEHLDPTPWLEGGDLLLTTGMAITDDPEQTADYVDRLLAADVAGLGFGVGLTHTAIPEHPGRARRAGRAAGRGGAAAGPVRGREQGGVPAPQCRGVRRVGGLLRMPASPDPSRAGRHRRDAPTSSSPCWPSTSAASACTSMPEVEVVAAQPAGSGRAGPRADRRDRAPATPRVARLLVGVERRRAHRHRAGGGQGRRRRLPGGGLGSAAACGRPGRGQRRGVPGLLGGLAPASGDEGMDPWRRLLVSTALQEGLIPTCSTTSDWAPLQPHRAVALVLRGDGARGSDDAVLSDLARLPGVLACRRSSDDRRLRPCR